MRARIGIDLTPLLPTETGVDTYLLELVRALATVDGDNEYHVLVNHGDVVRVSQGLGDNFRVHRIGRRGRLARLAVQQALVPVAARRLDLDVLHSTSFFMPLARGRARHLLTVFDMTFFTLPGCHTRFRRSWPFRRGVATSIRRADTVTVPSEFVRSELLQLLPDVPGERLRVVPLGVSARFTPAVGAGRGPSPAGVTSPYVLFVGTLEPRKDLETLLAAWRLVVTHHDLPHTLVIAGKPGWGHRRSLATANGSALRDRTRYLEYVPTPHLVDLYRGADCFVYPSLCEGFGFPPLEAMACGVATVATDTSALRENLRDAAMLVPVRSPEALAAVLAGLLSEDARRARLAEDGLERARRFTWERTARGTLACYEELAARRR